jgi:adenosine kinase
MLIVTGTIAYDYIMDFPGSFGDHILPDQTHNINLSFTVNKFAKRRGGTAGNTSYTLNLLKTPHVLLSAAGKDFSEYKKHFKKIGIDVSNILIDKSQYSSTGFAMTDKKDNQIWGYFPGASKSLSNLNLKKITKKDDFVLVGPSGIAGTMSYVKQCVDLEVKYMFDLGFIVSALNKAELKYGISHADIIIGNDYEIAILKQKLSDWKKILKDKTLITTLGEKGAQIQTKSKTMFVKPALPKKLVDPTGAGDAWRAGFLAGFDKRLDLQISGQMGAVAATFAIEHYGPQEHRFTIKEFKNRYRQTYGSLIEL